MHVFECAHYDRGFEIVHSRRPILALKPRCPTGNARIRERLQVVRARDLGFLVERKLSTRNKFPSRGSIRGIPRFSCQNLVFAVYFLRKKTRLLSNIRRIPKNPSLLAYCSKRFGAMPFVSVSLR